MPLNRKVITKWVEALRSGDYQQGQGFLRQDGYEGVADKFCCWGVLCDLYQKTHPSSQWATDGVGGSQITGGECPVKGKGIWVCVTTYYRKQLNAPNEVTDWAGIDFVL